jgi:hypothetical protein
MQAALAALGLEDFLDVEIVQMVRLVRSGTEVKFSKRSGEFITLRDLFEETGVDVARYFFLMRRSDAQMLFDLDLALDQSEKNPVYKVQYAHARMMSIFRKAGVDADTPSGAEPGALSHPVEQELIKQLAIFPEVVARAADAESALDDLPRGRQRVVVGAELRPVERVLERLGDRRPVGHARRPRRPGRGRRLGRGRGRGRAPGGRSLGHTPGRRPEEHGCARKQLPNETPRHAGQHAGIVSEAGGLARKARQA